MLYKDHVTMHTPIITYLEGRRAGIRSMLDSPLAYGVITRVDEHPDTGETSVTIRHDDGDVGVYLLPAIAVFGWERARS